MLQAVESMALDMIASTYRLAAPHVSVEEARHVVDAAIERAREKHADFDRFLPGMEFLATVFFTDHKRMPLDDYLETLYCGVKHADYSKKWRAELRKKPPDTETVTQ
jgi:hypothetical protein